MPAGRTGAPGRRSRPERARVAGAETWIVRGLRRGAGRIGVSPVTLAYMIAVGYFLVGCVLLALAGAPVVSDAVLGLAITALILFALMFVYQNVHRGIAGFNDIARQTLVDRSRLEGYRSVVDAIGSDRGVLAVSLAFGLPVWLYSLTLGYPGGVAVRTWLQIGGLIVLFVSGGGIYMGVRVIAWVNWITDPANARSPSVFAFGPALTSIVDVVVSFCFYFSFVVGLFAAALHVIRWQHPELVWFGSVFVLFPVFLFNMLYVLQTISSLNGAVSGAGTHLKSALQERIAALADSPAAKSFAVDEIDGLYDLMMKIDQITASVLSKVNFARLAVSVVVPVVSPAITVVVRYDELRGLLAGS